MAPEWPSRMVIQERQAKLINATVPLRADFISNSLEAVLSHMYVLAIGRLDMTSPQRSQCFTCVLLFFGCVKLLEGSLVVTDRRVFGCDQVSTRHVLGLLNTLDPGLTQGVRKAYARDHRL